MIQLVKFSLESDALVKLDRTKVQVQIVGEYEDELSLKVAVLTSSDPIELPEEIIPLDTFPERVLPCLGTPGQSCYLTKADLINNRYNLNDQIKLVRKQAAGDPAVMNEFVSFNEFCEALP